MDNLVGYTSKEIFETAGELVRDPELCRRVEEEERSRLNPGESFWIDGLGCGHWCGNIYVSNVTISVKDCSNE
jgi:hypothetical protein